MVSKAPPNSLAGFPTRVMMLEELVKLDSEFLFW